LTPRGTPDSVGPATEEEPLTARSFRRAHNRQAERLDRFRRQRGARFAASAGASLGAGALLAPSAAAETFTVTNLNDAGSGSLREAVADAGQLGDDVIVFQSGLSGTITLTTGDIDIFEGEGDLDIQGPGASVIAVSGNNDSRIFEIYNSQGYTTSISGLTLRDGFEPTAEGGAIYNWEGSGSSSADLILAGVVITGNEAASGSGGGVYNRDGVVTITNSVISGNEAGNGGGALYSGGAVRIADSTIADNRAGNGGGVYIEDVVEGGVVVERSSVTGNIAEGRGGGFSAFSDEGGVLIDSSTFSANETDTYAGGIFLAGDDGPIVIRNTTVSGNSAGERVGGIANRGADDVPVSIQSSTVVGNIQSDPGVSDGAGIHNYGEDDPEPGVDVVTLSSTVVAGNTGGEGDLGESFDAGRFELGFSLVGSTGNATTTESPAGSNIFGVDPQLGPLSDNGGPTQTHAPALTSPVLDHGIGNALAQDQRGLSRTSDLALVPNGAGSDGTDIGSVEIQAAEVEAQCQATTVRRIGGTTGDDTLTGTDAPEALFGLAGNDAVSGAGGNDCANGDEGRDNVKGGPGKDIVKGGAGKDKGSGGGGKDKVKGQAGKDNLKGGGGADRLSGAGGKDKLSGGGGKDRLKGGPGKDKLTGGGGKDRLNCGGGKDTVTAQPRDKVSRSCEKVVEKG
jgi:hypothetical protein